MTATTAPMAAAPDQAAAHERLLDATVTSMAVASTCVILGLIWDISWHRTIGRDTFWTPAHMVIYAGGLITGVMCATLVFKATFGKEETAGVASIKVWGFWSPSATEVVPVEIRLDQGLRANSVRFWGFRAPIGAWVAIWGAIAMLTSAPFDNWWHEAYGLDVKVLSPPHALLGMGMMTIQIGALLLAASRQHAAGTEATGWRRFMPRWIAGLWLAMFLEMVFEYRVPNLQHGAAFYVAIALTAPIVLAAAARGLGGRWPATTVAACYMAVNLFMVWLLPRFAATPLLGPIYNPLTHMVSPFFPVLLIFPAMAFDVIIARNADHLTWRHGALAGVAFTLVLLAVQWPFASFLLTPAARNPIFAVGQWDYATRDAPRLHEFWDVPPLGAMTKGLLIASVCAALTTRIGVGFGAWLARVRR